MPNTRPTIRTISLDDLPALKRIIDANGLFPFDMLDEMTAAVETSGARYSNESSASSRC